MTFSEADRKERRASRAWLSTPAGSAKASPDAEEHRRRRYDRTEAWLGMWEERLNQRQSPAQGSPKERTAYPMLHIACMKCGTTLSTRGMQVQLVSNCANTLYSTDEKPHGIEDTDGQRAVTGRCGCSSHEIGCSCGAHLGYRISQRCAACWVALEDRDHQWFMNSTSVEARTQTTPGGHILTWPGGRAVAQAESRHLLPSGVPPLPEPNSCGENKPRFSVSPLRDSNGRTPCGPLQKPEVIRQSTDEFCKSSRFTGCEKLELNTREKELTVREEHLISRENDLFGKDLQLHAHEKQLQGISSAQQEAENQLRRREAELEARELAVRKQELLLQDHAAKEAAAANEERTRAWAAVNNAKVEAQEAFAAARSRMDAAIEMHQKAESMSEKTRVEAHQKTQRAQDDASAKAAELEALRSAAESLRSSLDVKASEAQAAQAQARAALNEAQAEAIAERARLHSLASRLQGLQQEMEGRIQREEAEEERKHHKALEKFSAEISSICTGLESVEVHQHSSPQACAQGSGGKLGAYASPCAGPMKMSSSPSSPNYVAAPMPQMGSIPNSLAAPMPNQVKDGSGVPPRRGYPGFAVAANLASTSANPLEWAKSVVGCNSRWRPVQ